MVNDLVLSEREVMEAALRTAIWAAIDRAEDDREQVIDVRACEVPVRRKAGAQRLSALDVLALSLAAVMALIFAGSGIALLMMGGKYAAWSLVGFLDVVILAGFVVWVYGRKEEETCEN